MEKFGSSKQVVQMKLQQGQAVLFSTIWTWHAGPITKKLRMSIAMTSKKGKACTMVGTHHGQLEQAGKREHEEVVVVEDEEAGGN